MKEETYPSFCTLFLWLSLAGDIRTLRNWTILTPFTRCSRASRGDSLARAISAVHVRSRFFLPRSRYSLTLARLLVGLRYALRTRGDRSGDGLASIISAVCVYGDLFRPRRRTRGSLSLTLSLIGQLGDGGLADGARKWADATVMLPWMDTLLLCGRQRYRLWAVGRTSLS